MNTDQIIIHNITIILRYYVIYNEKIIFKENRMNIPQVSELECP